MNDILHIIINWTSPIILMIMGVLLLALGIPSTKSWRHLRYGCYWLSASYFILGAAVLSESLFLSTGHVIHFKVQLVLAVAFFQAMLFTSTSLAFIRPQLLTQQTIRRQLLVIVPLIVILFLSYRFTPSIHSYVFAFVASAYLVQLWHYARVFRQEYQQAMHLQFLHYREDTSNRLHWVHLLFYLSLGVGLLTFFYVVLPFRHLFSDIFVLVYTSFYVYVVLRFVVYSRKSCFEDEVDEEIAAEVSEPIEETPETKKQHAEEKLAAELDLWVREERYLCPDSSLEEVADELHTDIYTLHDYFLSHKGILFRTWRVMLRIEKAKELLEENPTMKISELQTRVGFSDKSYFFRRFKQVTGKTPNEYRNEL